MKFSKFILVFLAFAIYNSFCGRPVYIKVFIDKKNQGHEVYSANIYIGQPAKNYRLQVDFGFDKISVLKT